MLVPFLLGILHGHAEAGRSEFVGADGFAAERFERVLHREEEAFDERTKVDFFTESEFRALEFDDGHFGKDLRVQNQDPEGSGAERFGFFFGNFGDPDHRQRQDDEQDETDGDDRSGELRSGEDQGGEEDVDKGGFEKDDPAEFHQLIVAETRHGPADEDEEEDKADQLRHEHAEVDETGKAETEEIPVGDFRIERETHRPATEEKRDDHGRADDHGGVFAHEEHGEFHRRILRVITSDQFGFAFGKVEGHPVGFSENRNGEDQEGDRSREPEQRFFQSDSETICIPDRQQQPTVIGLVLDDFAKIQVTEIHQNRYDRKAERDFVGNHLSRRTNAADEREFRIRRPTGNRDAVNAERSNRENKQWTDIKVRDDQFFRVTKNRDRRPERYDTHRNKSRNHCQRRSQPVEGLANVVRREVFLEEKFQTVGDRLDQTEKVEVLFKSEQRQRNANPVRADAVLDDRRKPAFEINRNRYERQHHHEGEDDDLEEDDEDI